MHTVFLSSIPVPFNAVKKIVLIRVFEISSALSPIMRNGSDHKTENSKNESGRILRICGMNLFL